MGDASVSPEAASGLHAPPSGSPTATSVWASDGSRYAFVSRRLVYGKHGSFHGLEQLGKTLAFVAATPEAAGDFAQKTIERWYATRHLWLLRARSSRPVELPGTTGAAAPVWSLDGKSILYVADDKLWLIPRLGERPRPIAGPLFPPNHWPSYYGQIDWTSQFAWLSP